MKPFSTIAKRFLAAGSLLLLAACGSNGVTDPTDAALARKKSGYITVSAATVKTTITAPVAGTTTVKGTVNLPTTNASGYNVPAN